MNQTPLIARIYGEQGRQHPDWVRYELELLAYLADSGISVAAPIPANDAHPLPCKNAAQEYRRKASYV